MGGGSLAFGCAISSLKAVTRCSRLPHLEVPVPITVIAEPVTVFGV
jgi:hypothetical protein